MRSGPSTYSMRCEASTGGPAMKEDRPARSEERERRPRYPDIGQSKRRGTLLKLGAGSYGGWGLEHCLEDAGMRTWDEKEQVTWLACSLTEDTWSYGLRTQALEEGA